MQARFLLGPAGSGKTFRCLAEIRRALREAPDGAPLLLLAPKQTTYQLERQLLADPEVPGYTRLRILSFERLAHFLFAQLHKAPPRMLDEEGRLMVLRGLLARKRKNLKLFRASARLTGFARQLSTVLSDFQRHRLTPDSLRALAAQMKDSESLSFKLQDLALLLEDYLGWLTDHNLQDTERLLSAAAETLAGEAESRSPLRIDGLWVDGFAEFSPQELELLAALAPRCESATITLCLEKIPAEKTSWLSTWSAVQRTFEQCRGRLEEATGADLSVELLERNPARTRFLKSPVLQHLEQSWTGGSASNIDFPSPALRVATCADPEGEAALAAREVMAHVRAGGRYREVTVLVRDLEGYHQAIQRVFERYEIPYFLDRRESVSHHPLAELTRSALRTVAFQWNHEDWFAALKTGFVCDRERDIDELENEALARGWKGAAWHQPIRIRDRAYSEAEEKRLRTLEIGLEKLRSEIVPPFERFELALAAQGRRPNGLQLAAAIRGFWDSLGVEAQLTQWAATPAGEAGWSVPSSVHATVWEQMNIWLRNVELAFSEEAVSLREWLPILEAGLSNLSVGVIPPALDQVLVGAVDRSRNPEVKLALVLGLNETVFPASPRAPALLTESDHGDLEKHGVVLGATARLQLSRERHHGYIACTRASERLVLTSALHGGDTSGARLNPSPFLSHVQELFPKLEIEKEPVTRDWRESRHPNELMVSLLSRYKPAAILETLPSGWERLPVVGAMAEQMRNFRGNPGEEALTPALASRLYGPVLRTSVSRMEQFAACPFRFFVHSGLRAEERKAFELDVREQGTFQHDALAEFHEQLQRENKRWRDITPVEARRRIGKIAEVLMTSYRDGLLQASEQSKFMARMLSESLQDFIETIVSWMHRQYLPDPKAVELPFGTPGAAAAWELELGEGHRLALRGRIDRIDVHAPSGADAGHCVVLDYKSSEKKLDPLLVANGLQLQLLAYLNVICQWAQPRELFGVSRLVPAGVFYINLRGGNESAQNRREALATPEERRIAAYRHTGRYDVASLRLLDARKEVQKGDQFNYRLRKDGGLHKNSREALSTREFEQLLASVASILQTMGRQIFAGVVKVDPFRRGTIVACEQCEYRAICRIDPWTHKYRTLGQVEQSDEDQDID